MGEGSAGQTRPLVCPGRDARQRTEEGAKQARDRPRGQLAAVSMAPDLHTGDERGIAFAPKIRAFLQAVFQ